MSTGNGHTAPAVQESPAAQVQQDWRMAMQKMSYRAVIDNIPYLSFLALLCMLYISNNHKAADLNRQIDRRKHELEELNWRYLDARSKLMQVKAESQVMQNAEAVGLAPSRLPAYKVNR